MFSVVIPLYNKSHTIERTIASVLSQTFTDYEVIIVNDGSTDNGIDVIKRFTNDQRIQIINQENQGVSAARNLGVAKSHYEYIAFLDGDDEWMPDYLVTINEALKKYPEAGMICCAGIYRDVKTNSTSNRLAQRYKNQIISINYFENPHVFTQTSATTIRKEAFFKINGFPVGMKKNEDFALFYSIALIYPTVYCGFPLSCYNGNVEGQSTKKNEMDGQSDFDVCNRYNITYDLWNQLGRKNKLFKTFLKYELRHSFITALKDKDYRSIDIYLNNLKNGILQLLTKIEIRFYQKPSFRRLNISFIIMTKVIWRMNGFPRVK